MIKRNPDMEKEVRGRMRDGNGSAGLLHAAGTLDLMPVILFS